MFESLNGADCNDAASIIFDCHDQKPRRTKKLCQKFQQGRVIYKVVALLALTGGACVLNHLTDVMSLNTDSMLSNPSNEKLRTESNESYRESHHIIRDLSSNVTAKKTSS